MKIHIALLVSVFAFGIKAQSGNPTKPAKSNYVVIGAFSSEENAVKFTEKAHIKQFEAEFAMNPDRQLFYVYVLTTSDRPRAFEEARKLRTESDYWDTWVFSGVLGATTETASVDIDPVTNKAIPEVSAMDKKVDAAQASSDNKIANELAVKNLEIAKKPSESTSAQETKATQPPTGRPVIFKLFSASKGRELEGSVDMIDVQNSEKMASYTANKVVTVPFNEPGKISFVCDLFGFRKLQKNIDIVENPGEEMIVGDKGEMIIPFELVRLRKGDISVMYNVYFFKDAAIMRPESRYEVNSLLEMMKENPNYKIKIHGHTNGGGAGKIISKGKDSDNFFSLTGSSDGFGSAKKLSQERARIIREYLIAEGINEDRLIIKAWGGKRPLFDKNHPQAQTNVRVEIEIIED